MSRWVAAAIFCSIAGCTCQVPTPDSPKKTPYAYLSIADGGTYKLLPGMARMQPLGKSNALLVAYAGERADSTDDELRELVEYFRPAAEVRHLDAISLTRYSIAAKGLSTASKTQTYKPGADGGWELAGMMVFGPQVGTTRLSFGDEWTRDLQLEAAAVEEAGKVLSRFDRSDDQEAYARADPLCRKMIDGAAFKAVVQKLRAAFGAVRTRSLRSVSEVRSFPGAPDGWFVEVQFLSAHELNDPVIESVVLRKGDDGQLRLLRFDFNAK